MKKRLFVMRKNQKIIYASFEMTKKSAITICWQSDYKRIGVTIYRDKFPNSKFYGLKYGIF